MANTDAPTEENFHFERSRFLDSFATLEEAMAGKPNTLDNKLLANLRAIRNDLVHSQIRFLAVGGERTALFLNTQSSSKVTRQARLVALKDFGALRSQLGQAKKSLG